MKHRVRLVLAAALGLPDERIHDDFDRMDSEEWDSLAHVRLTLALEEEFKVRFDDEELALLNSVETIASLVQSKTF
jgi:acyl carrier protein